MQFLSLRIRREKTRTHWPKHLMLVAVAVHKLAEGAGEGLALQQNLTGRRN